MVFSVHNQQNIDVARGKPVLRGIRYSEPSDKTKLLWICDASGRCELGREMPSNPSRSILLEKKTKADWEEMAGRRWRLRINGKMLCWRIIMQLWQNGNKIIRIMYLYTKQKKIKHAHN